MHRGLFNQIYASIHILQNPEPEFYPIRRKEADLHGLPVFIIDLTDFIRRLVDFHLVDFHLVENWFMLIIMTPQRHKYLFREPL